MLEGLARRLLAMLAGIALAPTVLQAQPVLPVFLADNHGDTFPWIVRTVDPDRPHLLVLVDAHADSTTAERSDEIRESIRRVSDHAERVRRAHHLRDSGRIQAYNWIEPLMPRPVERVWWFPGPQEASDPAEQIATARRHLDGRLEVEPRDAGRFADRLTCHPWQDLGGPAASPMPVILALDLDAFTGMPVAEQKARFNELWQQAMRWPNLCGVAIAVSRPWLKSDEEADALVTIALETASRTRGAEVEIDITPDTRPDDSLRAGELRGRNEVIPRWDYERATGAIHRLVSRMPGWRLVRRDGKQPPAPLPSPSLVPDASLMAMDGVWRYPVGIQPAIRIVLPYGMETTGRVKWHRMDPDAEAVDLIPHTGLGKDFSGSPARWVHERLSSIAETTDLALDGRSWAPNKPGRIRILAEVETRFGGWVSTSPMEARFFTGEGFHAALSECMGMPYVFGIAGVDDRGLDGVHSGWGSDCANFLVHAWRRNGHPFPWGDPGTLRQHLQPIATNIGLDSQARISPEDIRRGIAIDFGRHVAAIWEDRGVHGVLDPEDLAIHHLGGLPEIIKVSKLCATRPRFDLRVPRDPVASCTLRMAGDVVLASSRLSELVDFRKSEADLFIANLEGIPSMKSPADKPHHDFRFAPERLAYLVRRGVDCVSLANNHAGDAGPDGLVEGIDAIRQRRIAVVGAGGNQDEACMPWTTEHHGIRTALFGVCIIDSLVAGPSEPGVAHLPTHRELLASRLKAARTSNDHVVVMLHGGNEYSEAVNESQRGWSRWLIRHGATVISGSHPHVVQPTEPHAGAWVFHSQGNAVYPEELGGRDSGWIREVELLPAGAVANNR